MKSYFLNLFISAIFLLTVFSEVEAHNSDYLNDENIELLCALDSLLSHADDFVKEKEDRISQLRAKYMRSQDAEHMYWMAMGLYEEYASFDSDSALYYADRCVDIARKLEREDLCVSSELNRIYVLTTTGLLDKATASLHNLEKVEMNPEQKLMYYELNINLSSQRNQYEGYTVSDPGVSGRIDSLVERALDDKLISGGNYGWIAGWNGLSEAERYWTEIMAALHSRLESGKFDTREDALDAYVLSRIYDYTGNKPMRLKYLIMSAMADIRGSVREMASLEEVARILAGEGDFERANDYVNYCIGCASGYRSRIRMVHLGQLKDQILSSLYRHSQEQRELNRKMVLVLVFVVAGLILAVLFIVRQMRQLSISRKELGDANIRLHRNVEELQKTRHELDEANTSLSELYAEAKRNAAMLSATNEAKEQYIANVFSICSEYITKLDDFRKRIYRLITARKLEELSDITKTPDLPYGEMKMLYSHFDRIFLQIYPDFVDDFNSLLREDERIVLRSPHSLTTELRIYALVRLGLNDSMKIARFLHISVQTVYNTRQRTRNKAKIPKETFAEAVQKLGKANI